MLENFEQPKSLQPAPELDSGYHLESEETTQEKIQHILEELKLGNITAALDLQSQANLPEGALQSSQIQSMVKDSIRDLLEYGRTTSTEPAVRRVRIKPEMDSESKRKAKLSNINIQEIIRLKEAFGVSDDFISSPEIQEIAVKRMIFLVEKGLLDNFFHVKNVLHVSEDYISSSEVEEMVKKSAAVKLRAGAIEAALEIIEQFRIDPEDIKQIDKENSENLNEDNYDNYFLIRFIPLLGGVEIGKIFPLTMSKVRERIFSKLSTDEDLADYFIENIEKYYQQSWVAEGVSKAIEHYSVAQKFSNTAADLIGVKDFMEEPVDGWVDEPWVADMRAKAKVIIEEHEKQFPQNDDGEEYPHGNQGFSESDPFANHPWRFGGKQVRIASLVSEAIEGNLTGLSVLDEELKKENLNAKEIYEVRIAFSETSEKVNSAYQSFLDQILSNSSIKEEDKQALLNPHSSSITMIPLLDNVRSFVARYLVQSVEGDITRLSEIGNLNGELDRILAEGFSRYIKIHEIDIPLYDKLYEEFDTLRETGRSPLEVYLGRDGIYAYIGRHSQDVARRKKLGLEGRKKLKEMGEVIEIRPQYTVYPRYFRDNIDYETKRQFLKQEGISPDADPLFYDTGYTGTIPEQIMRLMDFSGADIEKRIRLLSAPSVHRRVKGIPENARSEIIEYIEHNAKTEETAEGLIIDEKTGKIRHIAKPTNPEEQFYFMMVKQAIARHYWLQEKLHHEPSGNVNLDSEHYTIRIRQEYAKLLPSDFMQNPKEFLTQHGEMLKGSKGEGEYPDEEVILFKMTDGTEIVAKKIELRKAKEAQKEFSILISAKKAGLPTAEPVGFLSGKEDTDGSYLLMKKIEGISGRNFDKYLRDSGKFTEEKIKNILQQVAEKNKEMAELFRTTLKIDKRWRIKDTIIELNEETGEVGNVIPIDWERAQNFNPATPKEIDEII